MKRTLLFTVAMFLVSAAFSQKVDSIAFHLYTDSLKKGQHNYINVDGKLSNGKWLPLTAKDVVFTCPTATFEGNELIIPANFKDEKVIIRAVLKSNMFSVIERTIWIKKKPDDEVLPSKNEVMDGNLPGKSKGKNKNK